VATAITMKITNAQRVQEHLASVCREGKCCRCKCLYCELVL